MQILCGTNGSRPTDVGCAPRGDAPSKPGALSPQFRFGWHGPETGRSDLSVAAPADEVRWHGDYAKARAEAARLGRPIIIVVTSESCGWCRRLEQTTLHDGRIIRLLNESTVPLKIDADDPTHAALIKALRVEGLPTIAALGSDGRVLSNQAGYLDASQFQRLVHRAVDGSIKRR